MPENGGEMDSVDACDAGYVRERVGRGGRQPFGDVERARRATELAAARAEPGPDERVVQVTRILRRGDAAHTAMRARRRLRVASFIAEPAPARLSGRPT